jgi:hypothetical protein
MKYSIIGLGVKFGGKCVCCGRDTGSRDFERADTLLLRSPGGFAVAHPRCAGVETKSAVGGGRVVKNNVSEVVA